MLYLGVLVFIVCMLLEEVEELGCFGWFVVLVEVVQIFVVWFVVKDEVEFVVVVSD